MVSDRSEQFARRGVPEVLNFDNGPQFRESMKRWDFEHMASRLKRNQLELVSIHYNGVP